MVEYTVKTTRNRYDSNLINKKFIIYLPKKKSVKILVKPNLHTIMTLFTLNLQ